MKIFTVIVSVILLIYLPRSYGVDLTNTGCFSDNRSGSLGWVRINIKLSGVNLKLSKFHQTSNGFGLVEDASFTDNLVIIDFIEGRLGHPSHISVGKVLITKYSLEIRFRNDPYDLHGTPDHLYLVRWTFEPTAPENTVVNIVCSERGESSLRRELVIDIFGGIPTGIN